MSTINKVPAGAGAEWLLGAFALIRKAPLALGLLGVIWGLLTLLPLQAMVVNSTLGLLLQFGLALLGPFLFAGMLWAVHDADQGKPVTPAHLFREVRGEHALALLSTLMPQIAAALILGLLLYVMIGPTELQHLAEVIAKLEQTTQSGGQPDPELVRTLPVGRMLLWVLALIAAVVAVILITFVAVPGIVFGGRSGFVAMRDSLRACLHNLLAMLVFYVLLAIAFVMLAIGIQLLAMLVQLVAGPTAGIWVSNLLLMGILMPVLAGAAYYAWRQMLGDGAAVDPAAMPTHLEA
ncbi:BPSS1780 family membrane protein [Pseudoxanthomonas sp. CF125]|uniref:BPSS1780 family membrane protein n=1 Tax=Pseudoxanthomonas sp. CF125 TaxID=1855303 RepID=UPI000880DFE8|nr:BPSS1780 family membrane protein [Pseudoxanthomonas sp. CF125]SDR11338.1 hypothetical protein SAMN05216569_3158 [Pseudoxanthomonas sp. CF125]